MKALLIDVNATGIVDLTNVAFLQLDNVANFKDINLKVSTQGKRIKDFKYHIFNDDEFIPAVFRVVEGFYNQMQEFNFERVSFKELPITEQEKKKIIEKRYSESLVAEKQKLLLDNLELLYAVQVDETKQSAVLDVTEKLEKLNTPIVYTEHLNDLV